MIIEQDRVFVEKKANKFIPRVVLTGVAALGIGAVDLISQPSTVSSASLRQQICEVGVNIKGVRFINKGGRNGIYDKGIDEEVGPASGFRVIANSKTGEVLGSAFVDESGRALILNINRECNTVGPNRQPAYEFFVRTDENPAPMRVIAEHKNAANVTFGREVISSGVVVPSTPSPERAPTVRSTPVPVQPIPTQETPVTRVVEDRLDWYDLVIPALAAGAVIGLSVLLSRSRHVVRESRTTEQTTVTPPPTPGVRERLRDRLQRRGVTTTATTTTTRTTPVTPPPEPSGPVRQETTQAIRQERSQEEPDL